ncbi:MAG: MBL fold metallo-hydrolase [Bacteroidota bacterium]
MTKVVSLTFNPLQENTYVVYETDSKEAIIFDPGCFSPAEERQLLAEIERLGLRPVRLINTHCHLDHVFGNAFVANTFSLELGIHPLEVPVLAAAPQITQAYGLPPMTPSPSADYFLNEGDTLQLGKATFTLLLCPGHSPGSLCFYNAEDNYVIAGDVLFAGSIGRTDLPGGDFDTLMGSIHGKLFQLPGTTIVYPGHGPATTIGRERESNPWLQ